MRWSLASAITIGNDTGMSDEQSSRNQPAKDLRADSNNPYAPPKAEPLKEILPQPIISLPENEPIRFSGRCTPQELNAYLRAYGHISLIRLTLVGMVLFGFLSFIASAGPAFAAISFGTIGFIGIVLTVSTLPYRRAVFVNLNPQWNQPVTGEISEQGIFMERNHNRVFYRWDWFDGAIFGNQVAAFIPATQTGHPVLIGLSMLNANSDSKREQQWQLIHHITQSLGIVSDNSPVDEQRARQNDRILRERNREQSIVPNDDAVVFRGTLTKQDLTRITSEQRPRQRLTRSRIVTNGLLLFAATVLGGLSQVALGQFWILPGLLLIYTIAWHLHGRRRQRTLQTGTLYFLNAFANTETVCVDLGITSAIMPWRTLELVEENDAWIALRRRNWPQFIVARADMFRDLESWNRYRELAKANAGNQNGSTSV